jgi:hypothetical protein
VQQKSDEQGVTLLALQPMLFKQIADIFSFPAPPLMLMLMSQPECA